MIIPKLLKLQCEIMCQKNSSSAFRNTLESKIY